MFDLRYHVASLAAVFFALVIGILVGVALASRGLGDSERDRLEENLRRSENRAERAEADLETLRETGSAERAFVNGTYKLAMANRLNGKRIAVLFVGSVDGDARAAITQALADSNAGAPLRITAVEVPIDVAAITRRLANRPFLSAYAGRAQLDELGRALGQEFTGGAETPLWNALQSVLVEQEDGPSAPAADGVVVVRSVEAQTGPTARLLEGLYAGVDSLGVPAVGVEVSGDDGASIE